MSILVTRPSPDGEALVSRLRALGREAWHFPLIEFARGNALSQLPALLGELAQGDLLFAVSRHAVQFAQAELAATRLSWPGHIQAFAVGRTTALALHTVSRLPISYPRDRETSETLLQLPELQNVAGKRALILRGNGGRELLTDTLSERGAAVTVCECYQRQPCQYDGLEEAWRWQNRGIRILVVTSGEMLTQLTNTIPELYRTNWLFRCRLVVVSERLAQVARELGWEEITVAENADNDALLRTLQSLY
ncbi:uroporphyrinogen-III synthase [Mangrovibacter plantisponsor]|uniref:Uroporphyrinogen-III synthase n=1 Tax=Mangrovibacter plantisponsor TaxID=451513 RepID=A0A317PNP3_9ENTR|nr:uroporphyrinogen-III synthase [Mangrovibacter plantisponsor]PWW02603.1 uroporphyrinogen-III synthase [Mangrovibacter plantisponsor]